MKGTRSTTTGTADATMNTNSPAPLLINAKAACALLCVGERRLWSLTNCGAIPSFKVGKSVRYSPAELASWIASGCPTQPGAGDRIRKGERQ